MTTEYTSMNRAPHTLHEALDGEDFRARFEATTGRSIVDLVDQFVEPAAPKAVFVAGSLTLGMGASGSDVDMIVLTDDRSALKKGQTQVANNAQELEFSSASDLLLPGIFLTVNAGVLVDLHVAITPAIHRVYSRLRRRGPQLDETECRTLGRLQSAWLLYESEGYMTDHSSLLSDPALPVYCCTRDFVSALHQISKAERALERHDIPLSLSHGRESVEYAYLAYFSSEGMTYLGSKWLAQLGHARGAPERMQRHPLLAEGVPLLFPQYTTDNEQAATYLRQVAKFLTGLRKLIERKTLFRIALHACPQAHALT